MSIGEKLNLFIGNLNNNQNSLQKAKDQTSINSSLDRLQEIIQDNESLITEQRSQQFDNELRDVVQFSNQIDEKMILTL